MALRMPRNASRRQRPHRLTRDRCPGSPSHTPAPSRCPETDLPLRPQSCAPSGRRAQYRPSARRPSSPHPRATPLPRHALSAPPAPDRNSRPSPAARERLSGRHAPHRGRTTAEYAVAIFQPQYVGNGWMSPRRLHLAATQARPFGSSIRSSRDASRALSPRQP
jgi:hypothetical protein